MVVVDLTEIFGDTGLIGLIGLHKHFAQVKARGSYWAVFPWDVTTNGSLRKFAWMTTTIGKLPVIMTLLCRIGCHQISS